MSDIDIIRRRDWAYVYGRTIVGGTWLLENVIKDSGPITISLDTVEDFAIEVKKAGLSVEVK